MARLKQDREEAEEDLRTAATQIDTLHHQVAHLEGTAIRENVHQVGSVLF